MTRRQVAKRRPAGRPASPVPVPALDAGPADGEEVQAGPSAAGGSDQEQRQKLIADFAASLEGRDDLDEDGRDFLLQQYREAVESAPADLSLTIPDRMQWIETVDALKANGLLSEEDSNNLVRSFEEALHPLQSPEFKDALEFARRLRSGDEESALAWLASRRESADADDASGDGSSPTTTPEHTRRPATGDRRVRRPRGPPAR